MCYEGFETSKMYRYKTLVFCSLFGSILNMVFALNGVADTHFTAIMPPFIQELIWG